jgi:hypothetical protein
VIDVEPMDWSDFAPYFTERWFPGEHVEVEAPTGSGKTTLVGRLAELELPKKHRDAGELRHVACLDPKGGDDTLEETGWERHTAWPPPRRVYDAMDDHDRLRWPFENGKWRSPIVSIPGEPQRLIIGPKVNQADQWDALKEVLAQAIDGVFNQGHWTVIIDELQIASDQRLMNLTGAIERNYIAARTKSISMVGLHQAPRRVPRAASDQARWMFVSLTYDTDVIDRLAEQAGRQKPEIRGAIRGLSETDFTWGLFSRNPRDPFVVTRPPPYS